jgi:hypothetical protein
VYFPQEPKEPSGCVQTIILTRMIIGILLVPMLLILGVIFGVLLTFYALTIHPQLALLTIGIGAAIIVGAARWEARRIAKEMPPPDE